jgi:hypothetical protein
MVPSQDLAAACVGGTSANQSDIIAALVRTITVGHDKVTIEINRRTLADRLLDHEELSASVVEPSADHYRTFRFDPREGPRILLPLGKVDSAFA